MKIAIISLMVLGTIFIIIYPLFFSKISEFLLSDRPSWDYNEQDSLLAAISELDTEYELGRLSEKDYQHLKTYFQKRYLKLKREEEEK